VTHATGWSEAEYANAAAYLGHRAELIITLGPPLRAGDTVLDLACGDAALAEPLLARAVRYVGVDTDEQMVAIARRRLDDRGSVVLANLNEFAPAEHVAAVTCFRAIYYTRDRPAFFRRVAGFVERKLVFDLNPRQYRVRDIVDELHESGFQHVVLRPFFVPQTRDVPRPALAALTALERSGPVARLMLRRRFTYLVAAAPG
jgi:ubiquinone/menaquinone biosynthesis C-methylase UbiE